MSEKLVYEAVREANAKNYPHLYVIDFVIQPNARDLVEKCREVVRVPATYVQAMPDLMIAGLRKNMHSNQIFSGCELSEIQVHRKDGEPQRKGCPKSRDAGSQHHVELLVGKGLKEAGR